MHAHLHRMRTKRTLAPRELSRPRARTHARTHTEPQKRVDELGRHELAFWVGHVGAELIQLEPVRRRRRKEGLALDPRLARARVCVRVWRCAQVCVSV